jgi:uncharacterized Zn-binding protein involved in type VI secretion
VTFATPAALTYGTALDNSQVSGSANWTVNGTVVSVAGTYSYTTAAGTVLSAGTHTESVTFTPTDNTDYNPVTSSVAVTVNAATPNVTFATPAALTYGTALDNSQVSGSATWTVNGSPVTVAGTVSYSGSEAGTVLDAGSYTESVAFTPTDNTDYNAATGSVNLTVNKATTVFSNLTVQQITVGTATTTVVGQLTSNTIVPIGQSVAITLNGVTQSATVATNGGFSSSFATSGLSNGTYTISYSYAGNNNFTADSGTGSLIVGYGTKLLFNNTKPVHSPACLPIKLALTDASGTDVSSPNIAVTATSLVDANGNSVTLNAEGNSNPNNVFRYDASLDGGLGGYIFNLDTRGLAAGTYTFYYKAGNDPTLHSLTFVVD